jgi:hypothetical protein
MMDIKTLEKLLDAAERARATMVLVAARGAGCARWALCRRCTSSLRGTPEIQNPPLPIRRSSLDTVRSPRDICAQLAARSRSHACNEDICSSRSSAPLPCPRFSVATLFRAPCKRAPSVPAAPKKLLERSRPGREGWPTADDWQSLNRSTSGRLLRPQSPIAACATSPNSESCREALASLQNPFYLGDQVALTQTSGWVGAWSSQPSAYAVAAETAADVAAAVDFARKHSLRLVVKGGGHSYKGNSCSPGFLTGMDPAHECTVALCTRRSWRAAVKDGTHRSRR